jgi:hypothetical protein
MNDKDLGVMPDNILAERYGVSRPFIGKFIVKNKIKRNRNNLNLNLMLSFFAIENNEEVARRFRVPMHTIEKIKAFLNIADDVKYDASRTITKTSLCDYCLLRSCINNRLNILDIVVKECNKFK